MIYQIDQSGKIEQTSLNTIIACSNGQKFSLILHRRTKRVLQDIFRNQGKPKMFIYDTFAALLAMLIFKLGLSNKITIDKEYIGREALIKARLLEFLGRLNPDYMPYIEFGLVGKSSPAHILAEMVGTKKVKADWAVSLEEISGVLWPQKKTGYFAINETEGNLTQDWVPGDQKPSRSYGKILAKKGQKVKAKRNKT